MLLQKLQLKNSVKKWTSDVVFNNTSDFLTSERPLTNGNEFNSTQNGNEFSSTLNGNAFSSTQNGDAFHFEDQNGTLSGHPPGYSSTNSMSRHVVNGHGPRLPTPAETDTHMPSHPCLYGSHDPQGTSCDPENDTSHPHPSSSMISSARGATEKLLPEQLELDDLNYTRFNRNISLSSSAGARENLAELKMHEIHRSYLNSVNTSTTEKEKRDVIQALSSRMFSTESLSVLTNGSSVDSCGDVVVERRGSMEPTPVDSTRDEYLTLGETTTSVLNLETIAEVSNRHSSSSSYDNDTHDSEIKSSKRTSDSQSPFQVHQDHSGGISNCTPLHRVGSIYRKLRKTSSDNKLQRMNKIEDNSISPVLEEPQPPTMHAPIQRHWSEGRKVLVCGGKGTSVTFSLDPSCDDGDGEGGGEERSVQNGSSFEDGRDENENSNETLSFPIQRNESIGNGTMDKVVLGHHRGSISVARFNSLSEKRGFQYLLRDKKSVEGSTSQQLPTDVSSSPCVGFDGQPALHPTHSPNSSPSNSQLSSLGESTSGVESSSVGHDVEEVPMDTPDPESALAPQYNRLVQNQTNSSYPNPTASWNGHDAPPSTRSTMKNTTDRDSSSPSNFHEKSSKCDDNFPSCSMNGHGSGMNNHGNGYTLDDSHGNRYCAQEDEGALDPHIFAHCSLTDSDISGYSHISHTHQQSVSDSDSNQGADSAGERVSVPSDPVSAITKEDMEGMYAQIDKVTEQNWGDLEEMRSRGKIMRQLRPMVSPGEDTMETKVCTCTRAWSQ